VRRNGFQPSRQVLKKLAARDVSLTLRLGAQLLRRALPQLSHHAVRDPLGDAHLCRLPFRRHRDADQKSFSLLITANGRQSAWAEGHTMPEAEAVASTLSYLQAHFRL
jgi:hypothetical protein